MNEIIRRCRFAPYRRGQGPAFTLELYDTGRTDSRGCTILGYRLYSGTPRISAPLFRGEDFAGSPLHADDSDDTIRSLMTFLTLRPGDVETDYFDGYTDAQRDFCDDHAEALGTYVACDWRGGGQ